MQKIKTGILVAIMAVLCLSVVGPTYAGGDLSNPEGPGELPEDCQEYSECLSTFNECIVASAESEPGACLESSTRYIGRHKIVSCDACAEGYSEYTETANIPCGSYTYIVCTGGGSSEELYCPVGSYADGISCQSCPTATNVYTNSALSILARGTTEYDGATSVSECALPSGTYFDATGTFTLIGSCQY